MRTVTALSLVLGLLAAQFSAAQETPSTIRQTTEMLIRQLDSTRLAERAHAERLLLDLGPPVLAYLPPPELASSASVREAVKRIRIQLERQAARESAQASLITLSGPMTVGKLLKEISTQTRNPVEIAADLKTVADQSLAVDFQNRPFWECLDDICQKLKLRAVFDTHAATLKLRPRRPGDPQELAVQRTGPFRLAVDSVEIRPIVGESTNQLLRISARLGLEPRLRPLFLHFAAANLMAADASGKRLAPWNPAATYELPVGDAGREVPVQFDYIVSPPAGTTVNLVGRLSLQLAAGTERIVFDQASQTRGAARRRGGVTVRLRGVEHEELPDNRLRSQFKITVTYDAGGPAFESHRTWMFHNAVYFEDESGRRLDYTDYDTSLQSDGAVGVDYRWDSIPGPSARYRFVYEAPTLILDVPMEVQLEAVPIKSGSASPVSRDERK